MNAKLKLNLDRLTGTFDVDPSSSRIYSRDAAIDLIVHGFDEGEVTPAGDGGATPPGKPVVQFVNGAGLVVAQAMLARPTGDGSGAGADGKYDLVATLSTNTVEMRREFFGAGPQAVREFTVRILDTETANPLACGPFPVWNFPGVCGDAPTELPSASEVIAELRRMIGEHVARTDNPHAVTAVLISALTQAEGDARYAFKASVTTLSGQVTQAVQQSAAAVAAMRQHSVRADNPHGVTAAQVGLGNVDNTADADKPVSARQQTAIATAKEQVANLVRAEARRATDAEAALGSKKQDKLSSRQLAAVNSGIDSGKVAKIAQNESAISAEASRATTEEARLQSLISAIKTFDAVVADSLPNPSEQYGKKLYLIPSTNPETRNVKDEFICVLFNGTWAWEQVGSTAITIEFDNEPTEGSQKAVRSGGIWSWVKSLLPHWLTSDYAEPATAASVATKADKATPSAAGNLAALTADGNLSDSGKTVGDFLPRVSDGPVDSSLFMDMDGYIRLKRYGFIYGSFDNIREEGNSPISLRTELDSKVESFESVGGATATVENGVAKLDGFFTESNSLLNGRLAYSRNETGLKDRAFNTLSFDGTEYNLSTALAAVTPTASGQPRDLLIVATATAATTISFTAGTIKGDKPTIDGSGTWLITLTEYASGVWYCRQIKMEDAA